MNQLWFEAAVVAALLSGTLRFAGATARTYENSFLEACGWMLCAGASSLAAAVAGTWIPIWQILLLGASGVLAEQITDSRWLGLAGDLVFVTAVFGLSVAPVNTVLAVYALVAYALFGLLVDEGVPRIPRIVTVPAALIPIFLITFGLQWDGSLCKRLWQADATFPAFLGVTVPSAGAPTPLNEGGTAWVIEPAGSEARGGVLLLHGADSLGAHQRAVYVLQRALSRSGYIVVSLDHPGYGNSQHPAEGRPISSWDPLPRVREAYDLLGRLAPQNSPRIVVGHSMGTTDVLRLMASDVTPTRNVIIGGSMPDPPERNEYWYARFHRDRGMSWRMCRDKWRKIRNKYYNTRKLVHDLERNHSPVLFVQLGVEWANIRSQRDELWEALPSPKQRVELGETTHYLNSFYFRPGLIRHWFETSLVVADTRMSTRLRDLLLSPEEY